MIPVLFADVLQHVFGILMFLTAVFLTLLVLVQRGRGGGLAGAFGGLGGQSAFGTKAGDMFTRITIVAASFWILLCMASVLVLSDSSGKFGPSSPPGAPTNNAETDDTNDRGSGALDQEGGGAAGAPSGESEGPSARGDADPGSDTTDP